ncbi:hypothetical protein [Streptomyces alkaliterrae]|uniref:Uncharacterized protein n=1 Tax=Streptomyces alkaliterrae TaxID=2213162 RepID=A0A5P0YN45_9ACTN|nr:hypothetical protein [Streptomyces alkaliterrae]MBB1257850.1 hypothetical protein [Streptomyces alkaliterrae]MQS01107.1 hypothetical protein [Streptomyces alkaliterrae]
MAVGSVTLAITAMSACSDGSTETKDTKLTDRPEITAEAAEVRHFSDLPTMVATSDLVVEAEVVKAEAGPCENDESDHGTECVSRARLVTLKVADVLHAKKDTKETTLQITEGEWNTEGDGVQVNGVTWTTPGDRGVYFLTANDEGYSLVNSQGRVIVTGEKLQPTAHDDKLLEDIEKMTFKQLTTEVERASKAYSAGQVAALPE